MARRRRPDVPFEATDPIEPESARKASPPPALAGQRRRSARQLKQAAPAWQTELVMSETVAITPVEIDAAERLIGEAMNDVLNPSARQS